MSRKRNLFCGGISATLALTFLFTGCSNSKASDSSQSSTDSSTPYEVTYYYIGNEAQPDNDKVMAKVNDYLKNTLHDNTTLNLQCLDWGTYATKMKSKIAAGESFDLCYAANWVLDYTQYIHNGAYLDWGPYLNEVPAYKKEMGDLLDKSKIEGKNFLLPTKKEMAVNYGFLYNKTLADKYHLDFSNVKSITDLEPIMQQFHAADPDVPTYYPGAPTNTWNMLTWFNGGSFADPQLINGKYVLPYEQSDFQNLVDLMRKWSAAGYIPQLELTTQSSDYLSNGKFLIWAALQKPGVADEQNAGDRLKGFEVASIDITKPVTTNDVIFGNPTALSRTSKNPARAAKLYEELCTDKTLTNLINFGIEGVHYTKNTDDTISRVANSQYQPGVPYELGNQFLDFIQSGESLDKYKKYEEYNAKATEAPDLGFIFDPSSVSTQSAAVAAVVTQYQNPLILGLLDDAGFKQMESKLKTAGIDDILKAKQEQYDKWKASKK